jgi:hypothetical protein
MRLYIRGIIEKAKKPMTLDFTDSIENSLALKPKGYAERIIHLIFNDLGGINVKSPDGTGRSAFCADPRVEPRPQGGFAISCIHPFPVKIKS